MAQKLAGKVAVVTGASKGIGASIAKHLAAEGASVVVNYASSKAGADKVVNEITGKGGQAIAVQGDVSKQADIDRLFAETKKAYKKLDILVNNAGVYEFAPLEAVTEASFHKLFNLNVLGLLLTTQAAAKHFGEGASVINIGSGVSRITPPNSAVYTATKGAVDAITGVLSRELGAKKIRVNSINPGIVETEGTTPRASSAPISRRVSSPRLPSAARDNPTISAPSPCSSLPTTPAGSPVRRFSLVAACAKRSRTISS